MNIGNFKNDLKYKLILKNKSIFLVFFKFLTQPKTKNLSTDLRLTHYEPKKNSPHPFNSNHPKLHTTNSKTSCAPRHGALQYHLQMRLFLSLFWEIYLLVNDLNVEVKFDWPSMLQQPLSLPLIRGLLKDIQRSNLLYHYQSMSSRRAIHYITGIKPNGRAPAFNHLLASETNKTYLCLTTHY